jgi:hypothetical protein
LVSHNNLSYTILNLQHLFHQWVALVDLILQAIQLSTGCLLILLLECLD